MKSLKIELLSACHNKGRWDNGRRSVRYILSPMDRPSVPEGYTGLTHVFLHYASAFYLQCRVDKGNRAFFSRTTLQFTFGTSSPAYFFLDLSNALRTSILVNVLGIHLSDNLISMQQHMIRHLN